MTNILQNSTLSGFKLRDYFTDKSGNTGAIEDPTGWEYTYFALEEDPNMIPQSLHRDDGFAIAAGYRKWEAGYVQKNVVLKAGQRYLAKAQFFPDVNFNPGLTPDPSSVQWRFWIESGDLKVFTDWMGPASGEYKKDEEVLFVFQAAADISVDYYFKARSTSCFT